MNLTYFRLFARVPSNTRKSEKEARTLGLFLETLLHLVTFDENFRRLGTGNPL